MRPRASFERNDSTGLRLPKTTCGKSEIDRPPEVTILFTSKDATRVVIAQAASWVRRNGASLRILVMQVVPFPERLDHPTRIDPSIRFAKELAGESAIENTTVAVYLCRNVMEGFRCAVDRQTPVFMGAQGHSWWTGEWRLSRKLQNFGYLVCCVDVQKDKAELAAREAAAPALRTQTVRLSNRGLSPHA